VFLSHSNMLEQHYSKSRKQTTNYKTVNGIRGTARSIIGTSVNCNWVNTRWQWYSKHSHTNNTQNNTNSNRTQITTVQYNNNRTAQITTEHK